MTTWSVVEEDTRKKRRQDSRRRPFSRPLPRFALLACLALVMVSLGAALAPVPPQEPAEPSFSERARSAALAATLRLKTAGEQLAQAAPGPGPGTGDPASSPTVTLLTTQARALLAPHDLARDGSVTSSAAGPSDASPAPSLPPSAAALAAALADSGSQRLADAAGADGGMARLLAAVGTAQLLQASSLAAGAGAADPGAGTAAPGGAGPAPAGADPAATALLSAACPPDGRTPSAPPPEQDASTAGAALAAEALAAVVRAEAETVYGYQAALPRLGGDAAQSAARELARHEAALRDAEVLGLRHCLPVPPREPGYALEQSFLAAPAAGLAGLETATLAAYGDLVALSDGETRRWGITGLLEAGRRAVLWGADPGPLPGLAADPAAFPALPVQSPVPGSR